MPNEIMTLNIEHQGLLTRRKTTCSNMDVPRDYHTK